MKKKIIGIIKKVLNTLNTSVEGQKLFFPVEIDSFASIYYFKYKLPYPKEKHYYLVLPNEKHFENDVELLFKNIKDDANVENISIDNIIYIDVFDIASNMIGFRTDYLVFYSPNDFFNHLFDFTAYYSHLKENREFCSVESRYVDRTIRHIIDFDGFDEMDISNFSELAEAWSIKRGVKPILLLGDRGMGKSWASRAFCLRIIKDHVKSPWLYPLPIFIDLGYFSKAEQDGTAYETVMYFLKEKYSISFLFGDDSLDALIKSGLVILVLDGYDDMIKRVDKESVNKQLWEIFSIIKHGSKVIVSSRVNHFNSFSKIYEHFAFSYFEKNNLKQRITHPGYTDIRQDFNIWRLDNMNVKELDSFTKKSIGEKDNLGEKIITEIQYKKDKNPVEQIITNLITIPAFRKNISILLDEGMDIINVLEQSIIMTVIAFNIESNKAIEQYEEKSSNNFDSASFDEKRKLEILEELAWKMIENETTYISISDITEFLKSNYNVDFEIIINDIKTQTVLKLKEDGDSEDQLFEFFDEGILSLFVALNILKKISFERSDKGFDMLGKYDYSKNNQGRTFLFILNKLIDKEMSKTTKLVNLRNRLLSVFENSYAYNPSTRFLKKNLELLDNKYVGTIDVPDSWTNDIVDVEKNFVLIPTFKNKLIPFKVSITPVTNGEFKDFVNSEFGSGWGKHNKQKNEFRDILNVYHLHTWKDEESIKKTLDHPVVYIGWYASAFYCNYLSKIKGLDLFYRFSIMNEKIFVEKNLGSDGYRLLTKEEWGFLERDENPKALHPWDSYEDEEGLLSKEGMEYKNYLLNLNQDSYPVKSGIRNKYGMFWMIGNVKSWVDSKESNISFDGNSIDIKGMTAALGEEGYKFTNKMKIPGQNTNIDVGMRVARSLSIKEIELMKKYF
ncbi:hypothetical protein IMCC3317_40460 [Kordia antarctica]|uniref:Sulfatase-modifying factor enzyme-like domain-containing protein n=1 Tax=Kordia antarctica TaxID=1218801 RepID=A0A7L4ZPU6_9FLAO|nr:SUMF1/EgtB/PvdO family nonheme iron enzyme [Kordia antarctica]QHI38652.1 hypothetical protein IMCC3317_40460 [Kordia antarctica]